MTTIGRRLSEAITLPKQTLADTEQILDPDYPLIRLVRESTDSADGDDDSGQNVTPDRDRRTDKPDGQDG
jgi:hypothetical protein